MIRKSLKIIMMMFLGVVIVLSLFGCGKQKYKLNFDGSGFESAKTEYPAGAKVTVRYDMLATDTDYTFWIDDDVEMKQDYDGGYVFTFTMPEHDVTLHESSRNSMVYTPENEIWYYSDQPVRLRYDRMWIYSDFAETEDPRVINEITDVLRTLEVGEPTIRSVTDYTDILTFDFADGKTVRIEFEENMWVAEDGERYEVSGLSELRDLLESELRTSGNID